MSKSSDTLSSLIRASGYTGEQKLWGLFSGRLGSTSSGQRVSKAVLLPYLLGVTAFLLPGCSSETAPSERFRDDVRHARSIGIFALPDRLPPNLTEGWVNSGGATTSVSFYSENAPVVTICTGRPEDCRNRANDVQMRVVELGSQHQAVITLGRREEPAPLPALEGELRSFWSDVSLTTGNPKWLTSR